MQQAEQSRADNKSDITLNISFPRCWSRSGGWPQPLRCGGCTGCRPGGLGKGGAAGDSGEPPAGERRGTARCSGPGSGAGSRPRALSTGPPAFHITPWRTDRNGNCKLRPRCAAAAVVAAAAAAAAAPAPPGSGPRSQRRGPFPRGSARRLARRRSKARSRRTAHLGQPGWGGAAGRARSCPPPARLGPAGARGGGGREGRPLLARLPGAEGALCRRAGPCAPLLPFFF